MFLRSICFLILIRVIYQTFSPVQVTSRENLQDDVFNGVRIPKGTIVVLPLVSTMFDNVI